MRKDSLKELELKVPTFQNIYIPPHFFSLTFRVIYFHNRTLTLPHIKLSRTFLVMYLQVCEMEGEHQHWTARHIAAVDAAQIQEQAKAESERNEFEQARTVLCCTVIVCTTSYFLLYWSSSTYLTLYNSIFTILICYGNISQTSIFLLSTLILPSDVKNRTRYRHTAIALARCRRPDCR
jgi:dipeptide/tripeptide permease